MDGEVPAGDRNLDGLGFGVDEPQVLRVYRLLGE